MNSNIIYGIALKKYPFYFCMHGLSFKCVLFKGYHMRNNLHTSPLSFEIGMSVAIFIIALLSMFGTILRICTSCINIVTNLLTLITDCSAKCYIALISRRRHNYIRHKVN